jgi:hypothetical protein
MSKLSDKKEQIEKQLKLLERKVRNQENALLNLQESQEKEKSSEKKNLL